MIRLISLITLALVVCGIASAAPPTQATWWEAMDRYTGEFQMFDQAYREPIIRFRNNWVEPRKLQHYSSRSLGNAPLQQMTGFVSWNEKNERIEWSEIMESEEEGRVASTGYCINATPKTMTWIVSSFGEDGFIRKFSMVDTFTEKGLERSVSLLQGKEMERKIYKWVRVE